MGKRPPEAPGLSYWPAMVVPAAEHAPADGKAFVSEQLYGGLQILRTYAPALQRTYTYTLPDETVLRLAGETVAMQEEVPVTAMTGDLGETDSSYDYTWQGETQNGYDAQYDRWQPSPAAENAVRLAGRKDDAEDIGKRISRERDHQQPKVHQSPERESDADAGRHREHHRQGCG